MGRSVAICTVSMLLLCVTAAKLRAGTTELLTNGGFETGDTTGWTVTNQGAAWLSVTGSTMPHGFEYPTVGPASGSFYAVSDQGGPGTSTLIQFFTVSGPVTSVTLSFDMFVNNWGDAPAIVGGPSDLSYNSGGANQHSRVDLLAASSGAFDTDSDVLTNFYIGGPVVPVDLGSSGMIVTPHPFPYTHYSFDITTLVGDGGTFKIRFATVANDWFLHQGIDNVSILIETPDPPATVPAPGALLLTLLGTGCVTAWRRRG
jgi:hypothetical protein